MSKYILLIIASFFALSGCEGKVDSSKISERSSDYDIICLDGVAYWQGFRRTTPVIDKETLSFVTCNEIGE
ncbi:hypothetical protein [Vibrio phage phiKT1024]|nr:hypothetical protein [Vibrio phage phiKT1024]